jgi:hypothetical protein
VRPDAHVAWRAASMPEDSEAALREALEAVLDRAPSRSDANADYAGQDTARYPWLAGVHEQDTA